MTITPLGSMTFGGGSVGKMQKTRSYRFGQQKKMALSVSYNSLTAASVSSVLCGGNAQKQSVEVDASVGTTTCTGEIHRSGARAVMIDTEVIRTRASGEAVRWRYTIHLAYPFFRLDCHRWGDVVSAINKAATSEREDQRAAARKAISALDGWGDGAAVALFLTLMAIDPPLAYSFDYTGFERWREAA